MQRRQVIFGVLGLTLAASAVRAAAPNEVTLLGQKYGVTVTPRHGAFKNGTIVNLQKVGGDITDDATVPKKANLAFAPGGTADADRLFVVAAHQDNPGPTSDGLYMLQGADANGVFSPENSNAFVLLRGNKDVHGRMQNVTFLNDTDTGSLKDRNLVAYTFTFANRLRWLDLSDLMAGTRSDEGAYQKATVFSLIQPGITEEVMDPDPARDESTDDPNMPAGNYQPQALAPNGAMITIGTDTGDWAFGVIDPLKGTAFYPVKTYAANTAAADQIDTAQLPHGFAHLRGDEYLILATDPDSGTNANEADVNSQTLYHVRITLPADLTEEAPDSLKVEVLGKEDVLALKLGQSPTQKLFGLAVGREVAAGLPTLYSADWAGNLITLRPTVASAGQ
jgi:hypothetical protein